MFRYHPYDFCMVLDFTIAFVALLVVLALMLSVASYYTWYNGTLAPVHETKVIAYSDLSYFIPEPCPNSPVANCPNCILASDDCEPLKRRPFRRHKRYKPPRVDLSN